MAELIKFSLSVIKGIIRGNRFSAIMKWKFKPKKIVKVSDYSFYANLPKVWCNQFGLDKGSFITMEVAEDGSLIIKPGKKQVGFNAS